MDKMTKLEALFGFSALGLVAGIIFSFGFMVWKLSEAITEVLF